MRRPLRTPAWHWSECWPSLERCRHRERRTGQRSIEHLDLTQLRVGIRVVAPASDGVTLDVLAHAEQPDTPGEQRKDSLFYANLYVALFYEAEGDAEKARRYMTTAVREYPSSHYMGHVARIHLQRMGH